MVESGLRFAKSPLRVVPWAAVLLGLSVLCASSHAILYTYGCRLTVTQVRASKEGRDGKEYVDEELSREEVRALKQKYKKGYKSYEFLSRDTASAGFNEPLSFPLANGKTLIVTFESHRQAWINMKLVAADEVQLMRVSSGERGVIAVRYQEEGEDALVIILRPRLIQATRT